MPHYSAFSYFGALAYSSKRPHGEDIYEAMRDGMGDTYETDFSGREQSRLYAQAVALADAQYQIDRAGNNITPSRALEMLGKLESDYQIVPDPNSSINDRRAALVARWKISRGARRESVESALTSLLGTDFISYDTISDASFVASPAAPGTVGVFTGPGATQKSFRLTPAISITAGPIIVPYTAIGDRAPLAGETYCVDPDPRSAAEQITIIAATPTTITADFARAHEPGAVAVRPHPLWISSQRYAVIRVTLSCAKDPVKRKRINELMARVARGVSQWSIAHNLGSLTTDDPVLGLTDCTSLS